MVDIAIEIVRAVVECEDNDTISRGLYSLDDARHIVDAAADIDNVGGMNYVDNDVVGDNNCAVEYEENMSNVVAVEDKPPLLSSRHLADDHLSLQ